MRFLFLSTDKTAIPFHVVSGLIQLGEDVSWTGSWPPYLLPIPNRVRSKRIGWREVKRRAEEGLFDVVVVSDRVMPPPIFSKENCLLVLIDTLDEPTISINHLRDVSMYFKCQLPGDIDKWILSDNRGNHIRYPSLEKSEQHQAYSAFKENLWKVDWFPYTTFIPPKRIEEPHPSREVFFLGWDAKGASNRRQIVKMLKGAGGFSFSGGLFKRSELVREEPPEELSHPKIHPISLYNSTCRDFKVNIAPRGNGQLSFRLYELLSLGCFVLAEELDVPILPSGPENGKDLVFFKSDLSDLLDLCDYYLMHDSERQDIARSGYQFFWENLTPKSIARYFIDRIRSLGKCHYVNFPGTRLGV